LFNIAMISTNGNTNFSKLISEALWRCDYVNIEKSSKYDTHLEVCFL